MKQPGFFLLCLLLFLGGLTRPLFADTRVRVGIYQNKPLVFIDDNNQPQGIYIDVLEYIAGKEGWQIEYVTCDWPICLQLLEKGELDLLTAIAYSRERAEKFDFTTETMFTNWAQIYVAKNSNIQSLLDLKGKEVAVLTGDIHYDAFRVLLDKFDIEATFVEVHNYPQVLGLVEAQQVDAGVVNRVFGAQAESRYNVNKSSIIFNPIEVRFAAPKNKSSALLAAIDAHLAGLKKDPDSIYYRSLANRLQGTVVETPFPRWVTWALVGSGGLLLVFIILNVILRSQVQRRTAQLSTSEARYRALVENAPLGIVSFDRQGRITAVNRALLDILGSPSEEDTLPINMLTFPLLVESGITDSFRRCLENGKMLTVEHPYTSKWGKSTQLRLHLAPLRASSGEITGAQALVEDVSALRRTEAALHRQEQTFQTILNSINDYVWSADVVNGTIEYRYYSPVVEKITGYPPDYFMTGVEAWLNLIHPADRPRIEENVKQELAGQMVTHEYRILRPDGQIKWLRGTTSPTINKAGQVTQLFGVVSDITGRKLLEEQLNLAQKMEAVGQLAGGIAHDFNNLLTAIMGYTDLALDMLPPDTPVRNDIRGIQKTVRRAANLTQQLLAFARRQISEPRTINLNHLILNIDPMIRRLLGENIELVMLPAQDLGSVKVDPGQFEQVLVNLAINARDAMPDGGKLTFETSNLTVTAHQARHNPNLNPGPYVVLTVTDTGIGMPEEVQAHIFEPFFTTKEVGQGTGLGLATCFGIVKQSGGHIRVHSAPGQGSTFKIYLPRVTGAPEQVSRPEPARPITAGHETILLAEDELSVRDLASRALRQHGYTVLEAANGSEALRVAQEQTNTEIHLLLTDVVMPQMGGVELADQLQSLYPNIKTIFMSGYTDSAIVRHGMPRPGSAFLPKPFTADLLIRKIQAVLSGQSPP